MTSLDQLPPGETQMKTRYFPDSGAMAAAAAEYLLAAACEAVAARGRFSLVLAGGRTPELLYRQLASLPMADQMPWAATHIFQGDERSVAPDHPESNFRLAAATLLAPGLVPGANIHRMRGEAPDLTLAAAEYQREIELFLQSGPRAEGGFDLVLLGMGGDGHIASLFPGSPLLAEQRRLVAAVVEPAGNPALPRLTLTLPAINGAARVLFMISGPEKQRILEEIMANSQAVAGKYPAALVRPGKELLWLVSP